MSTARPLRRYMDRVKHRTTHTPHCHQAKSGCGYVLWSSNNLCQNVRLFYLLTTLRSSVIMTFSCKPAVMCNPVIVQYIYIQCTYT